MTETHSWSGACPQPTAALGNSTYYPPLISGQATVGVWTPVLTSQHLLHLHTPAPWLYGVSWDSWGQRRREGGHLSTPGHCLPLLEALETDQTPGSQAYLFALRVVGCLRALALLVTTPLLCLNTLNPSLHTPEQSWGGWVPSVRGGRALAPVWV